MYQRSPSDSDDVIVKERHNGVDVFGQKDAISLHTQLPNRLTNQVLDKKSLNILMSCDNQTVLRCLQLCWAWCHRKILNGEPQIFRPFELAEFDGVDDLYAWDARVFVCLLRQYLGSRETTQGYPEWAGLAKTIGFCPINMLFAMSSFIVTVADNVFKDLGTSMSIPVPDTELDMAKLGAKWIEFLGGDELRQEFCEELKVNLTNNAAYAAAFHIALRRFEKQNEPETPVLEYSPVAEEGRSEDMWAWGLGCDH